MAQKILPDYDASSKLCWIRWSVKIQSVSLPDFTLKSQDGLRRQEEKSPYILFPQQAHFEEVDLE